MITIYPSFDNSVHILARIFLMIIMLVACTAHSALGQDPLVVKQGGVTLMIVKPGGNVGIGIANPAHKLHVDGGNINTSGVYKMAGATVLSLGSTGSNNTFLGSNAGRDNSSGISNTYIGREAGEQNITGNRNTFVGTQAGEKNTDAANVFVGYQAGQNNTGTGNVFVGNEAGSSETGSNKLYIANSSGTPLILGDFSSNVVTINGEAKIGGHLEPSLPDVYNLGDGASKWFEVWAVVGTIQTSDRRYKQNIHDLPYGLHEVMQFRPVSYTWKTRPEVGTNIGLIAQDVQSVISEVVRVGDDPDQTLGLNYSELVPVLIKAIQEQQNIIDAQNKEVATLREEMKAIQVAIEMLKTSLASQTPEPKETAPSRSMPKK